MISFRFVFVLISIVSLAGCIEQSDPENLLLAQARKLEKELKNDPNNQGTILAIANHYHSLYEGTTKRHYRVPAIKYYEMLSGSIVEDPEIQARMYLLYYSRILDFNFSEDIEKLNEMLKVMPPFARKSLNPPSLAVFYHKARMRILKDEEANTLLKTAIQEQPEAALPYIMLAEMYDYDKRYNLAFTILKLGHERAPDNVYLKRAMAKAYYNRGHDQMCEGQGQGYFRKSLSLYTELLKLQPENTNILFQMAKNYEYLGQHRLALEKWKRQNEIEDVPEVQNYLGAMYSVLNKADKAIEHFEKIVTLEPALSHESLAIESIKEANWKNAKQYYEKMFLYSDLHLGNRLLYSYASEIQQGNQPAINEFKKYTDSAKLTNWELKLKQFRFGEISEDELMNHASNKCENTESFFYIALNKYLEGKPAEAAEFLQKTVDEKIFAFIEYRVAKRWLKDKTMSKMALATSKS